MINFISTLLSYLTLAGQLLIAVLLLLYFFDRENNFLQFVSKNAVFFAFVVALGATLGSLFMSEIVGYEPCKLCWYQRILLYPQVILLGLALWKKEKIVAARNSIALSAVGAGVAIYHYLVQLGVAPEPACDVVGLTVSCSQRFVMSFGYITIPLMSLTAFALILVLLKLRPISKP